MPLNECKLYQYIKNGKYFDFWMNINFIYKFDISEELKKLLNNMFSYEPNNRCSIQEILESIWMKEINKMFEEKTEKLNDIENKIYDKFKAIRKVMIDKTENIYTFSKEIETYFILRGKNDLARDK